MAEKLSSMPNRTFAGPAVPSPKSSPTELYRRARHFVPPPSTPKIRAVFSTRVASKGSNPERKGTPYRSLGVIISGLQLVLAIETERLTPRYSDIDLWGTSDVLDATIEAQFAA